MATNSLHDTALEREHRDSREKCSPRCTRCPGRATTLFASPDQPVEPLCVPCALPLPARWLRALGNVQKAERQWLDRLLADVVLDR